MRSSNKGQQSSNLRGLKVSCRNRLLLARPLLALAGGETTQSNPQKPSRTRFGALVLGKVLALASYILCLTPFGGCSSGPSNPPVSVPLPAPEIKEAANCAKERGDHGANIYKCPSELGPIFVTTVKDCSIPEKFTFQATTRQLLVGVMDLTVMSQDPVSFNSHKALRSVVHGTMDVDPFIMSIYTFHQNECVTDLVVWRESSRQKPSSEDTDHFTRVSSDIAQRLVPKLIPAKGSSSPSPDNMESNRAAG
jgi:hypothetical protein